MIIGIDPDTDKSGMALIYPEHGIRLMTEPLWGVLAILEKHSTGYSPPLIVVIEANWLNAKGQVFWATILQKANPVSAAKYAVDVGKNHCIGLQIEAFCLAHGISHELFVPTKRTPKWDHETMVKLTGISVGRSNQEERDAVRAVYFSSRGREVFK